MQDGRRVLRGSVEATVAQCSMCVESNRGLQREFPSGLKIESDLHTGPDTQSSHFPHTPTAPEPTL